ncbi:hypothetical protein HispidOSU_019945, partial [Sigmodon hispidus]
VMYSKRKQSEKRRKPTLFGASVRLVQYINANVYILRKNGQEKPEKEMKHYADKVACPIRQLKSLQD